MNRLGATLPLHDVSLLAHRELLRELVDLGYTDLWSLETSGFDALTPLAAAATWAPELRLGSAIASVFSRGPALLAMEAASLAELAPGRFVLGIGSSSEAVVTNWNAARFDQPVEKMRDTLRFLRRALAGERIDEDFETFACRGFALERAPQIAPPIFVAALRERMLRLAAEEGDGVILGLLCPEDVPRVIAVAKPQAADREVALRIGVIPTSDADEARAICRRQIAAYLSVPTYAAFHRWLGRADALQPMWDAWARGDRRAAIEAVPDSLVDGLFVSGAPEACAERILAFTEAGVTTPIISLMGTADDSIEVFRRLAALAARASE